MARIAGYLVAYALPLILPSMLYTFLKPLPLPDILRDIILIAVIGVIVGLLSSYLCRDMLHTLLASIIISLLGLSTPLILMEITPQLAWMKTFVVEDIYTLPTFIVLPLSASATSITTLRIFMKKVVEVQKVEEKIETVTVEQPVKEEIPVEEKIEITQETMPTVSEEGLRAVEEKLVPELEEMLKEIMKEEVVKEEKTEPVEKIALKKCKHCEEYIPEDSIYCPLCGKYQGEES